MYPSQDNLQTGDYRAGKICLGTIGPVLDYGAFVDIAPGIRGLLRHRHIHLKDDEDIESVLLSGDHVRVSIQRLDQVDHGIIHCELRFLTSTDPIAAAGEYLLPASQENDQTEQPIVPVNFQELGLKPGNIRKVLLIEDNPLLLEGFHRLMTEAGFEVEFLSDATGVFEKVHHGAYDVIFLDAHTPSANGVEVLHEILEACSSVYIILMSGLPLTSEEKLEISKYPLVKYLAKPFTTAQLVELFDGLENGNGFKPAIEEELPPTTNPCSSISGAKSENEFKTSAADLLNQLVLDTCATAGVIFSLDLAARQVDMFISTGIDLQLFENCRKNLKLSPVKDVIFDEEIINEKNVLANAERKFKYLLPLLDFNSCIGIPLVKAGRKGYGLFIFSSLADHFTEENSRNARQFAITLKALMERWQIQLALDATHEFTLLGQSSAGLAHDMNNLIGALQVQMPLLDFYTKNIGKAIRNGQIPEFSVWKNFQDMIGLTRSTINSLQGFTHLVKRLTDTSKGGFSIPANVVENALQMTKSKARRQNILLTKQIPSNLPLVNANDIGLERVLINLIMNAIQNLSDQKRKNGRISIAIHHNIDKPDQVEIRVKDNGSGIHYVLWNTIFELGFTTRPNGSGLGLFIARNIIESFGGQIVVEESIIQIGTTFLISLPLAKK